jgi:hypothetical protein
LVSRMTAAYEMPARLDTSTRRIVLVTQTARSLTAEEHDKLIEKDEFPDWDCIPPDNERLPFEYKASDWGWHLLPRRPIRSRDIAGRIPAFPTD